MATRTRPAWQQWLLVLLYLPTVLTSAKSFRDNPAIGNRQLNRWGLHVWRKRLADRLGKLRRRQLEGLVSPADREAFERDGFIMKPDFLTPEVYAKLRAEITGLNTRAREAVIGDTLTRLIPLDAITLRSMPTTRGVLEGPAYRNLLDYIHSFRRRPHFYVQTVFSRYCDAEPDVQSFFHVDTFHPTVKAWLYLDDVGPEDAPFTYVPGSHRMTRRRLAWERRLSLSAAAHDDRLTAEGSLRISEAEIRRIGYAEPRRFPVKANTLVIADTSGIHKRSTTENQSVRLSLWAYSRSNPFLPIPGGDLLSLLPVIKGRALRLYWAVTDPLKDARRKRRDWRWVGMRSPLSPPQG